MARPRFIYPCKTHRVTCGFYCYANHAADDLGAVYEDCWAAAEGIVITAYNFPTGRTGRFIEIEHADRSRTRYLHLSRIDVASGQGVMQGQRIGITGASGYDVNGNPLAPHLHFALWYQTRAEALEVWEFPALTFGMWAVDPVWVIEHQEDDVSKQDVLDAFNTPMQELGNRSMAWVVQHQIDYGVEQGLHATIVGMEAYRAERPASEWPAIDAQLTALKGQELYYRQKAQGLIP